MILNKIIAYLDDELSRFLVIPRLAIGRSPSLVSTGRGGAQLQAYA